MGFANLFCFNSDVNYTNSLDVFAALGFVLDQGLPSSGSATMKDSRVYHTATPLMTGDVLITGGLSQDAGILSNAELYDPNTNSFSSTKEMTTARDSHTATMLINGKVLIAGGITSDGSALSSTELYDPTTKTFTEAGPMQTARYYHTATLLKNGKVLIAGGTSDGTASLSTAELYDPDTDTFSYTGDMVNARIEHTMTLLSNGNILIMGGVNKGTGGAYSTYHKGEVYYQDSGTFGETSNGTVEAGRQDHAAINLPNDKIYVLGGYYESFDGSNITFSYYSSSADAYDYNSNAFSSLYNEVLNYTLGFHTMTLLNTGKVLIAGGENFDSSSNLVSLNNATLYDYETDTYDYSIGSLNIARSYHTATLLPSGKVLVVGGYIDSKNTITNSTEVYDPSTKTWEENQ